MFDLENGFEYLDKEPEQLFPPEADNYQDDAELEESNNPVAMAVLTAKLALSRPTLKDQQLFDLAYNLARRLLTKEMPKEKIRTLMNFLRHYMLFENTKIIAKFERH